MYLVLELQTAENGSISPIVNQAETINAAESVYHQILAAAALSSVYKHGAVVLTDEGYPLMHHFYQHIPEPAPEPEPEPTPEPEGE